MNSNIKDEDLMRYYENEHGKEYYTNLRHGLKPTPDDLRKRFNIDDRPKTAVNDYEFKAKMNSFYRKFIYYVKLIGAARAAGELSRLGRYDEARNLMNSIKEEEKDK